MISFKGLNTVTVDLGSIYSDSQRVLELLGGLPNKKKAEDLSLLWARAHNELRTVADSQGKGILQDLTFTVFDYETMPVVQSPYSCSGSGITTTIEDTRLRPLLTDLFTHRRQVVEEDIKKKWVEEQFNAKVDGKTFEQRVDLESTKNENKLLARSLVVDKVTAADEKLKEALALTYPPSLSPDKKLLLLGENSKEKWVKERFNRKIGGKTLEDRVTEESEKNENKGLERALVKDKVQAADTLMKEELRRDYEKLSPDQKLENHLFHVFKEKHALEIFPLNGRTDAIGGSDCELIRKLIENSLNWQELEERITKRPDLAPLSKLIKVVLSLEVLEKQINSIGKPLQPPVEYSATEEGIAECVFQAAKLRNQGTQKKTLQCLKHGLNLQENLTEIEKTRAIFKHFAGKYSVDLLFYRQSRDGTVKVETANRWGASLVCDGRNSTKPVLVRIIENQPGNMVFSLDPMPLPTAASGKGLSLACYVAPAAALALSYLAYANRELVFGS